MLHRISRVGGGRRLAPVPCRTRSHVCARDVQDGKFHDRLPTQSVRERRPDVELVPAHLVAAILGALQEDAQPIDAARHPPRGRCGALQHVADDGAVVQPIVGDDGGWIGALLR